MINPTSVDKAVTAATCFETSAGLSVRWQLAGGRQQKLTGPLFNPDVDRELGPFTPLKLRDA